MKEAHGGGHTEIRTSPGGGGGHRDGILLPREVSQGVTEHVLQGQCIYVQIKQRTEAVMTSERLK